MSFRFGNKKLLSFSITLLSIIGYGFVVFAAQLPDGTPPPTGGYLSGNDSILDPGCAPQSANCVVTPYFVTTSNTYTWMGNGAGQNGGSTDNTVFIGIGAGDNADNADYSNFIGTGAGLNATNADHSNFFGQLAGCNATDADNANFFGYRAGCGATAANNSNFFGNSSGEDAVNGAFSTYFGDHAGFGASGSDHSNFLGAEAGYNALNAASSNFFGYKAGYGATNANNSNFMGQEAGAGLGGVGAVGADSSVFAGYQAGYNELGDVNFMAGSGNPYGIGGGSVFMGAQAGFGASQAVQSTFIGTGAGYKANTALGTTIIGFMAGTNSVYSPTDFSAPVLGASIVIGDTAATDTFNTKNLVVIGNGAIKDAVNIDASTFIGANAPGSGSTDIFGSIFLGDSAGDSTVNMTRVAALGSSAADGTLNGYQSILIGTSAGGGINLNNQGSVVSYTNLTGGTFAASDHIVGNLSTYSSYIISDTGSSFVSDEINPGYVPGEIITDMDSGATAQVVSVTKGTTSILIGSNTGNAGYQDSIALGTNAYNSAANQLMIGSQNFPINTLVLQGNGNTCTLTVTIPSPSCSSDESLKTNIIDLNNGVLDTLTKVRTVKYKWKNFPDDPEAIGFIAQDLKNYFPEVVSTSPNGLLAVSYGGMTPILTQAIRELNVKVTSLESMINGTSSLSGQLSNMILRVKSLVLGSPAKPTGITMYDTVTQQPYCVTIASGSVVTNPGECGEYNSVVNVGPDQSGGNNPTPSTENSDTTATETTPESDSNPATTTDVTPADTGTPTLETDQNTTETSTPETTQTGDTQSSN